MFRIITTFDSWHLNGVHCPSIKVGRPAATLIGAIHLYNESNYELDNYKDENKNPFTKDYLINKYSKREFYLFALDGSREGYIVILDN